MNDSQRHLRIAINLHGFLPGSGGVETYVENLLGTLADLDQDNEYVVLCGPRTAAWYDATIEKRFPTIVSDYEAGSLKSYGRVLLQRLTGSDLLARELRTLAVDVVHHPLTILNPPGVGLPAVLTFHDMQQEFHPEFFSKKELQKRHRDYLPSLEEAKAIITVSGHARDCLVERYQIPFEKISVVHHGYADIFQPEHDEELQIALTEKYQISSPFMIYPAATWEHKNHIRLLDAFRKMVDDSQFDGDLLLTGGANAHHPFVMARISALGLEGRVRWLGYVAAVELAELYRMARLMVFPSLYEGFGLPVVEAMACGCPVVCAGLTSLPEVAGDAALFFDPFSVDDMAETVLRLWADQERQEALRNRGAERVQSFSWERSARLTKEVYLKVCREAGTSP